MRMNLKRSIEKICNKLMNPHRVHRVIHTDFQIQEIFPLRLANPINNLLLRTRFFQTLLDLQLSREIFPVSEGQCVLLYVYNLILMYDHSFFNHLMFFCFCFFCFFFYFILQLSCIVLLSIVLLLY